jgi:hypothetical protein
MPKIRWKDLPPALRELRERKISAEDLYELKLWRESEPETPEGAWYKDFGSFKICGELDRWEPGRSKPNEQAAALIWLVRKYPDTLERLESLSASA